MQMNMTNFDNLNNIYKKNKTDIDNHNIAKLVSKSGKEMAIHLKDAKGSRNFIAHLEVWFRTTFGNYQKVEDALLKVVENEFKSINKTSKALTKQIKNGTDNGEEGEINKTIIQIANTELAINTAKSHYSNLKNAQVVNEEQIKSLELLSKKASDRCNNLSSYGNLESKFLEINKFDGIEKIGKIKEFLLAYNNYQNKWLSQDNSKNITSVDLAKKFNLDNIFEIINKELTDIVKTFETISLSNPVDDLAIEANKLQADFKTVCRHLDDIPAQIRPNDFQKNVENFKSKISNCLQSENTKILSQVKLKMSDLESNYSKSKSDILSAKFSFGAREIFKKRELDPIKKLLDSVVNQDEEGKVTLYKQQLGLWEERIAELENSDDLTSARNFIGDWKLTSSNNDLEALNNLLDSAHDILSGPYGKEIGNETFKTQLENVKNKITTKKHAVESDIPRKEASEEQTRRNIVLEESYAERDFNLGKEKLAQINPDFILDVTSQAKAFAKENNLELKGDFLLSILAMPEFIEKINKDFLTLQAKQNIQQETLGRLKEDEKKFDDEANALRDEFSRGIPGEIRRLKILENNYADSIYQLEEIMKKENVKGDHMTITLEELLFSHRVVEDLMTEKMNQWMEDVKGQANAKLPTNLTNLVNTVNANSIEAARIKDLLKKRDEIVSYKGGKYVLALAVNKKAKAEIPALITSLEQQIKTNESQLESYRAVQEVMKLFKDSKQSRTGASNTLNLLNRILVPSIEKSKEELESLNKILKKIEGVETKYLGDKREDMGR